MRKISLTKREKAIEDALIKGEFVSVDKKRFSEIAQAIAQRRKDVVLNMRVNSEDLRKIKKRAKKLGIRYQTFISEVLHRVAS
jgi:predicted DNA binding CopG/RHH family protein